MHKNRSRLPSGRLGVYVIATLRGHGPLTLTECLHRIERHVGDINPGTLHHQLALLRRAGLITRDKDRRVYVTERGRQALDVHEHTVRALSRGA